MLDEGPLDGALTPRQRQVARLALQGLTNREIAAELSLALHTVENYMSDILSIAGVSRRTQLVAWYWQKLHEAGGRTP